MFPLTLSREKLRLSGKQNSVFASGAHIKCIVNDCSRAFNACCFFQSFYIFFHLRSRFFPFDIRHFVETRF